MSFEGEKDFLNCLEFLDMIRDFNVFIDKFLSIIRKKQKGGNIWYTLNKVITV